MTTLRAALLALALALAVLPVAAPRAAEAQLPRPTDAPAAVAKGWTAGQFCWAFYEPHSAWYAAHVVAVGADSIRVEHFDGYDDTVVPSRVRGDFIEVGDTVGAFYTPDGKWYSAEVLERRGMDIVVRYSDGEEETTWLKLIRVLSAAPGAGN